MKRSLSILLIIVMLASAFAVTLPASAARNDVVVDTDSSPKPWESEPGWRPISNIKELKAIANGSTVTTTDSVTGESTTTVYMSKYYLTADITLTEGYGWISPEYVTIDGNGHTITITEEFSSIFSNPKYMEIRNLTVDGAVVIENADEAYNSPFARYNSSGWVKMENVISNVDVIYSKNTNRSQTISGLWQSAGKGSYFKNVVYNGTITISDVTYVDAKGNIVGTDGALVDSAGAIVGTANGTLFENVINNGDMIFTAPVATQRTEMKAKLDKEGHEVRVDKDGKEVKYGTEAYETATTVMEVVPAILVTDTKSKDENDQEYVSKRVEYQYYNNELVEIGGIAGTATNCVFNKCVNNCSIVYAGVENATEVIKTTTNYNPDGSVKQKEVVEDGVTKTVDDISTAVQRKANIEISCLGGFVGKSTGTLEFNDCVNNALIVLNAYDERYSFAGGFVGHSNGATTIKNSKNNCDIKTVKDGTWYIAGFAGYLGGNVSHSIENCVNNGKLTSYNTAKGSASNCGVGGFVGYAETTDGGKKYTLTFTDCINNGNLKCHGSGTMPQEHWGGFIGQGVGAAHVYFIRCVNAGDVARPFTEANAGYTGTGGFIGGFRLLGDTWKKIPQADMQFIDCINIGRISGRRAGGFYGSTTEIKVSDSVTVDGIKLSFSNCVNAGAVYGDTVAGGLAGGDANSPFAITVANCANGGNINSLENAGGMFGVISALSIATFTSCVNYGDIGSEDEDKMPTTAAAAGVTSGSGVVTYSGCINIGKIMGEASDPIALGALSDVSRGNMFLAGSNYNESYESATSVDSVEGLLAAVDALDMRACNYDQMLANIAEYRKYNTTTHLDLTEDNTAFHKLKDACDAAEAAIKAGKENFTAYSQREANRSYVMLLNALANLKEKIDFGALKDLVAKATEKLNDGNTYSETSVAKLKAEMEAANALVDKGDDATAKEVRESIATLDKAITTLRRVKPMSENNANTPDTDKNEGTQGGNNSENNGGENTQKPTETQPPVATEQVTETEPAEESGCGSVIGGAAVIMTAVIALGAGIALKKKED